MDKMKIGFVGSGFIADWHYRAFSTQAGVEVCGICQDLSGDSERIASQKKRLHEKARELSIPAYESFADMIADREIDALMIGSINPLHNAQIIAALEAGKHVLVEKPVVTDIAQLDAIVELSRKTGKVVFPAHNFVYREAVQRAKAVLDSGQLGRIIFSSFVVTHTISDTHANGWRAKRELGTGGTLMDSGHHLVYQMRYLLGRPQCVSAYTAKMVRTQMDCEDLAQVGVQYADGSVCTVLQSIASAHGEGVDGIRIVGEKGNLLITDTLYVNGERIEAAVDYQATFDGLAVAFLDAVREGKAPASSLEDVRDTLEIIYASYRSAEEGKTVRLNTINVSSAV